MNPERLLKHFDRIIEAHDAIARLRRFILDLAIRGKLVNQDPNDEPASEVLKRIETERGWLEKERIENLSREIGDPEMSSMLPKNWILVPLIALGRWAIGTGFPKNEQGFDGGAHLFLKVSDMNLPGNEKYIHFSQNSIDDAAAARMRAKIHPADTIIFPKIGGAIATNKRRILTRGSAIDNNCLGITFCSELSIDWCYLLLSTLDFSHYQAGTAVPALQQGVLERIPISLPPVAEQQRIVTKVDELMAVCDGLEVSQSERERRRDRLAASSMHRMNQSRPAAKANLPGDSQEEAGFYIAHLSRLTTRSNHVKQLRQTLLNLAVRGKIIKPEDGGVTARLLDDLQTGRLAICHSSKEEAKVKQEFERLLAEWQDEKHDQRYITTLCACHFITKGTTPAPSKLLMKGEVPFLKVYNIVNNKLDFDYRPTFIAQTVHSEELKRSMVRPGDVLMNIVGPPLGKVAMVTDQFPEWNINQALAFFRPLSAFDSRFIRLVLSAPITIHEVLKDTRGTVGQDNLSLEQVRGLRIPLITIEQQHRIVAKVDELMALCDQLEAQLKTTQTYSQRLLEALLHEALGEAEHLRHE